MQFSETDLELYVMGAFDGDIEKIETYIASTPSAGAYIAEQARMELCLEQIARHTSFCSACDDVVASDRCDRCGAAIRAGGYDIDRVLVETAHGRLYLARDSDGQRVALKELAFVQAPDAEALAAFDREAKFLRALEHPAIPRFVSSFREGDGVHTRLYLAQEFIDGEGLEHRLANHFFTEDEGIDIARQVLDVLIYLQSLSPIVVHRDIKPANLIRRGDGSIAVVDFGAALDQGQTQGSTAIGTFGYMPLEQMAGIVDSTTDLYALGASLWHLLTRIEPWKMLGSAAMDSANISDSLATYLRTLTAQNTGDRFPSAAAARDALDSRESRPQETDLATTKKKKRARREHRRGFVGWPLAVTAVGVVALGVGGSLGGLAIEADRDVSVANARARAQGGGGEPDLPNGMDRRVQEALQTAERMVELEREELSKEMRTMRHLRKKLSPPASLPALDKAIDFSFDGTLQDGLTALASVGKINLVVPNELRGELKVDLRTVPWHVVFETVLESRNLWYEYSPRGRLARVVWRADFDKEVRRSSRLDGLPEGPAIDVDLKDADIHKVLRLIADVGKLNIVAPKEIKGAVTVRVKDVPADQLLRAVLASRGLWFRYRDEGRILRVGYASDIKGDRPSD